RVVIDSGFNFRGPYLKKIVQLIAGLFISAPGAPNFTVDRHEPRLGGRFGARTAPNSSNPIDRRQFVIFLKEDHHSIRKHNTLGFLRMECGQWWYRNFRPWLLCDEPRSPGENH